MTNTISNIPPVQKLQRISPSRYAGLSDCILRELWSGMRLAPLLPSSPKSMLGTAIHKLLEGSGNGDITNATELDEHWNHIINEIEQKSAEVSSHLFPLKRSIPDYEIRRIRAFDKATEIIDARQQSLGLLAISEFEVWLCSTDGQVGGYVDELRKSNDGTIIRDFKTGPILEQSSDGILIKEAYSVQLKLYAALFAEKNGSYPVRLELVPLQGDPVEVPFTHRDCEQLLADAKALLNVINHKVESSDYFHLSSPSPATCGFCSYRPACPAYLQEIESDGAGYLDKIGVVQSVTQLRNGTSMLSLQDKSDIIHLRGIGLNGNPHPVMGLIKDGSKVGLFNISKAADGSYVENKLTTIYRYQ